MGKDDSQDFYLVLRDKPDACFFSVVVAVVSNVVAYNTSNLPVTVYVG